jgi:diaminopimelate epimerase
VLTRSHGLGNDYLVADPADLPFTLTPARVQLLCDRHRGVGSDGLLVLQGGSDLRIFNPDGSEAEKSGNGLRIFAKWLFDTRRVHHRSFVVRAPGGAAAVRIEMVDGNGRAREVTVDMGAPVFRDDASEIEIEGRCIKVVALSIGNPHCVILRDPLDVTELRCLGPLVERHSTFPERTNVQLARVVTRGQVELLIWERGAGETQASGSSATAVVAACQRLGLVDQRVTARMPGGQLVIEADAHGSLWLRGPVEEIARVTLSPELIANLQALP